MNQSNNPEFSVSYIADKPEERKASWGESFNGNLSKQARFNVFWEQRRYEASVAAMQGLIAGGYQWKADTVATQSVKYADALIEELRKTQSGER